TGARFKKHVDNTAQDGRVLTVLCYLNLDWQKDQVAGHMSQAGRGIACIKWPPPYKERRAGVAYRLGLAALIQGAAAVSL
ncbi:hypothetical protein CYMTET_53272, partial [Cymbomonas tetramitiformis]